MTKTDASDTTPQCEHCHDYGATARVNGENLHEACVLPRRDKLAADELRASAAQHDQDARDSFERCDTDGFVSQWGSGMMSQLDRERARIAEAGGTSTFPGLYIKATGERVRAVLIETADRFKGYGTKLVWKVVNAQGELVGWVNHSKGGPRSKIAKLGLEIREEQAPAAARHKGSGTGLSGACSVYVHTFRTDDGYPADAVDFDPRS